MLWVISKLKKKKKSGGMSHSDSGIVQAQIILSTAMTIAISSSDLRPIKHSAEQCVDLTAKKNYEKLDTLIEKYRSLLKVNFPWGEDK